MNSPAQDVQLRDLADGTAIPLLGLGVWQIPNGQECVDAVSWALDAGYRHIDTAQAYGNEEAVGQGLKNSGISRDQVYVTTKFHPARQDPVAELEKSLERLGIDFVDLYLVHWPKGDALWPWAAMERAHASGLARSIGVSNYGVDDLAQLREAASVQPVVNQVQFGPFAYRKELLEVCNETGVPTMPAARAAHRARPGMRRCTTASARTIHSGTVPTRTAAMPEGSRSSDHDTTPLPNAGNIAPSTSIAAHCGAPGRSVRRCSGVPDRQPTGSRTRPAAT
jgi:hypothetical protein